MDPIVVAGHVCVDMIPSMESATDLEPGVLVRVEEAAFSTGGAVSNTGLALHKLGLPVRLVGKVGDDFFGGVLRSLLQEQGVEHELVVSAADATSYSVVINRPGMDRTFLHCPGANDTFAAGDLDPEQLAGAAIFHFGYPPLMGAVYTDGGRGLARLFSELQDEGVVTSLDMARPDPDSEAGRVDWQAFLARVLPHTDLFLPSVDELLYMLDRERFQRLEQEDDLRAVGGRELLADLAKRILCQGPALAVFKLGADGLYLRGSADSERLQPLAARLGLDLRAWRGCELYAPCFRTTVAGTTGAGDCTIAGFLAGLAHGLDPAAAMDAATGTGAFSVEQPDATGGVPTWEELQARLRGGWKRAEPSL